MSETPDWFSDIIAPRTRPVGREYTAVPPTDGGCDDPYWQTPAGAKVMDQIREVNAAQAVARSEDDARAKAERDALTAECAAARSAAQAEKEEAATVAKQQAYEQAERERLAWKHERAVIEEKCAADAAARVAFQAALEAQDDDFHALAINLSFNGSTATGYELEDYYDFDRIGWELDEDEALGKVLAAELKASIAKELDLRISHYRSLGLIRADFANFKDHSNPGDGSGGPSYFLVYRAEDNNLSPGELGVFTPVLIELPGPLGGRVTLEARVTPVNASTVYSIAASGGLGVGQWGGEATPDFAPAPDEDRDVWLARVAIPRERLARLVERWRRSRGNLALFEAAGAASAQVARDRPISWIVPGLIPRGYVSLLVGTKQAGKSTLLGELLAVVDSECQAPRSFLGNRIEARGVSCLVSGEDGIDFVAVRNAFYEPVHGEAQGFVFVTAKRPWAEVLKLLYESTKIDVIGIDPMRQVMSGDEDSSGAVSQFFDELNALAQFHNCAIVLVHHTSKAPVRSLSAMLPAVRGSGAITDRVRVAVGMIHRSSDVTEVGIIKHNIPPSETPWGQVNVGRLFRRDTDTLTLVPIDAATLGAGSSSDSDESVLGAILDAIRHFNSSGDVLRRTGKHELFERKWPPLAALSRSALREGVGTLIANGRVTDGQEGLVATSTCSEGPAQ